MIDRDRLTKQIRLAHRSMFISVVLTLVVFGIAESTSADLYESPVAKWLLYIFGLVPMFYLAGHLIAGESKGFSKIALVLVWFGIFLVVSYYFTKS